MAAADKENQDRAVYPRSYEHKSYRDGFLGTLGDLQKAGVLQDVVLEVEGRRFPCHRLVLSAASPYFRAMFTSGMAESRQKTVILQGMDPDMFEEILSYIYSGTLHVSLDTVQPLYQAADLLQVDYVREICTRYMVRNVECSSCMDFYKFADAFSVGLLKDRCLQYICKYFGKVSSTDEFCNLSENQLTDIISHDGLDVQEETTVWEAVVRWVEHSREDRRHHLPSILPHIRFNLLTSHGMAAILEHPLIKEDPGCAEAIRTVVQRKPSDLQMRFGMDIKEMVLLFSKSSKEMLCMNPRIGRYVKCSFTGNLRANDIVAVTVTSNNNIYLLTRKRDDQLSLLVYNHLGNKWDHQSSITLVCRPDRDLSHEYLVEVDGHLYYLALVNMHRENIFLCMRRYDPHADQWQVCKKPRFWGSSDISSAVSCGQYLYFLLDKEMHCYHPRENRWYEIVPFPMFDFTNAAVAMGTELFYETGVGKMVVYETESNTWQGLPACVEQDDAAYDDFIFEDWKYFILEDELYMFAQHYDMDDSSRITWQICVYDRAKRVWRDLKATVPSGDWAVYLMVCPVARMYLPGLNSKHADTQS